MDSLLPVLESITLASDWVLLRLLFVIHSFVDRVFDY